MRPVNIILIGGTAVALSGAMLFFTKTEKPEIKVVQDYTHKAIVTEITRNKVEKTVIEEVKAEKINTRDNKKIVNIENEQFVQRGIDWLVSAQFENGGWGAGSHARQDVRDPRAVPVDPGTTAFAALALVRSGNTHETGKYSANVKKALFLLLEIVEKSPEQGPQITDIRGTQPQIKLGENIDVTLAAQFFSSILRYTKNDPQLQARVEKSLDKCVRKIQSAQTGNGSWGAGGWAPVLQSAMANNALELAGNMGRPVDEKVLKKSKEYQEGNSQGGKGKTDDAAGVELYSVTSTQRATAKDAAKAKQYYYKAQKSGAVSTNAPMSKEVLMQGGASKEEAEELQKAVEINKQASSRAQDQQVMSGFGNNGGEEFISFLMTGESMAITGGEEWTKWKNNTQQLLMKIQNNDGSWSGHHCITSPVFCTAACVLTMTIDNDIDLLTKENKTQTK